MNICNLEKADVRLDILWLVIHNPEINLETGEIKIMGTNQKDL